ncbi:hypothetical protein BJX70DRAFT_402567 [Aspergillus crustosus]
MSSTQTQQSDAQQRQFPLALAQHTGAHSETFDSESKSHQRTNSIEATSAEVADLSHYLHYEDNACFFAPDSIRLVESLFSSFYIYNHGVRHQSHVVVVRAGARIGGIHSTYQLSRLVLLVDYIDRVSQWNMPQNRCLKAMGDTESYLYRYFCNKEGLQTYSWFSRYVHQAEILLTSFKRPVPSGQSPPAYQKDTNDRYYQAWERAFPSFIGFGVSEVSQKTFDFQEACD